MDYEGLGRGYQLQNRVDPSPSQGLSQNGELRKSDLFLLRWIGSLPTVFPGSPKNRTRLSGLTEICPNVQRHDFGVFSINLLRSRPGALLHLLFLEAF